MTVPAWSMTWTWAGERGVVTPIDVTWIERVAVFDSQSAIRAADVECVLPIDVAALTDTYRPETGTAVLTRGGRIVLAGSWKGFRFSAPVGGQTRVTITLSESEAEDVGTFPPVTNWSPGDAARSYRVYNTQDGTLDPAETMDSIYSKGQQIRDNTNAGPLDNVTVNLEDAVGYTVFSTLAELSEGRGWPWPFGIGGSDTPIRPQAPAWVVDTTGSGMLLIAGCRVDAATVTVIGPDAANVDRLKAMTAIPVHHAISVSGREFAYVDMADLTDLAVNTDGFGKRWYTAWPVAGNNGGGGTLLALLYGLSSLRIDGGAFEAFKPLADQWQFAGYLDSRVTPTVWARDQLLSVLPVAVLPGPFGWRPILWPFIGAAGDAQGQELVDGHGVASNDEPVTYEAGDAVSRVIVDYAVRCDTNGKTETEYAGPRTTPYARAALPGGDDSLTCESIWDKPTAGSLAHIRLRARMWSPRQVPVTVLDRRYDVGGDRELFGGDVVLFTSARFGWVKRPAVVAEIERDGTGNCRMVLWLRDDPLRTNG